MVPDLEGSAAEFQRTPPVLLFTEVTFFPPGVRSFSPAACLKGIEFGGLLTGVLERSEAWLMKRLRKVRIAAGIFLVAVGLVLVDLVGFAGLCSTASGYCIEPPSLRALVEGVMSLICAAGGVMIGNELRVKARL